MAGDSATPTQETGGRRFHIDVTVVIVVVVLLVIAFVVKHEHGKAKQREVAEVEKARAEREAKEREYAAIAEEREKRRREDEEQKRKESREVDKERLASLERLRLAREKLEAERIAKEQELLQARTAEAEAKRKRREEEEADAAKRKTAEAAAEAQRLTEEQKTGREKEVTGLRAQYESAVKEISEQTARLEPLQAKMVAFKNKMDYAAKRSEAVQAQVKELSDKQGTTPTAGGTAVSVNVADEIGKGLAKTDAASKEYRDSAAGYTNAAAERDAAIGAIAEAKKKRDEAAGKLKFLGVEATASSAAAKTPAKAADAGPGAGAPRKTFVLKDGRKIVAVRAVEAGDEWSVKTAGGKFETISKNDVEKVVEE